MVLENLYGAVVASWFANVVCILHVDINLVFLSHHVVALFGEMVRNF